jgi:hypothetical protein
MMPLNVIARVKNMTRETRLGLLVSCSFLGLLIAVLGMKMIERTEEAAGPDVASAPNDTPPDKSETSPDKPAPPAAPPAFPRDVPTKPIVLTGATTPAPAANGKSGESMLPPLPPVTPNPRLASNSKPGEKDGARGNGEGLPPIPAVPSSGPPPVADKTIQTPPPPAGGLLSGIWSQVRLPAGLAAKKAPKTGGDDKGAGKPVAKTGSDLPALPPIAPAPESKKDSDSKKETAAVPPPLPPVAPPPATSGPDTPGAEAPTKPLRPVAATPLPPVPLPNTRPENGGSSAPPPAAGDRTAVAQATGNRTPTIDVGNISVGNTGQAAAPAVKQPEPIPVGRPPSAAVPPLPVAASPARTTAPDVVTYTEQTYVANAGDTYASISRAKYGNEGYAQALYLFNRSHPLAGDEVQQGDAVKPRQSVYLPPAEILANRYGGVVSGPKAAAGSGVTIGTTSQRPGGPPRTYRVAAGGEKLYDIAVRLLGDGNRWGEIRDQNPGWNPALPIPAGTSLTLPADARLAQ